MTREIGGDAAITPGERRRNMKPGETYLHRRGSTCMWNSYMTDISKVCFFRTHNFLHYYNSTIKIAFVAKFPVINKGRRNRLANSTRLGNKNLYRLKHGNLRNVKENIIKKNYM